MRLEKEAQKREKEAEKERQRAAKEAEKERQRAEKEVCLEVQVTGEKWPAANDSGDNVFLKALPEL